MEKSDQQEFRPRCDMCGYELTFAEYIYVGNKCAFHAEPDRVKRLRGVSVIAFVRMLFGDLAVARAKLAMRDRGLTSLDYQACVGTVNEDLRFIDTAGGMKRLVDTMMNHKGAV